MELPEKDKHMALHSHPTWAGTQRDTRHIQHGEHKCIYNFEGVFHGLSK
jgi:hypothetical protein